MNDFKKIAIVVISCDKYSDLHKPFFNLFQRFWPDCPFKTYLISNTKGFDLPGLTNILVGKDISWSDNLINALNKIEEEFVFLWVDDLFLIEQVDTSKVTDIFAWAVESGANYVCLKALPRPDKKFNDLVVVGIVSPGSLYRASSVLSLWNKKTLLELLKPSESAWKFEIEGSVRSDKYDRFYATRKMAIKVINGVIKGKWQGSAIRKLNSLGASPDLLARQKMSLVEEIVFLSKRLRSSLLRIFPNNFRRQIRKIFLKDK